MKTLLYIGNKLSKHGINVSTIETLGPLLEKEGFNVIMSSSKNNPILRLLDMIFDTVINFKKVDFVLIDTYSTLNFWYAFIISQCCRLLKIKYIPILHGGNLPNRIKKNPFLSRLLFNNSYINITPSGYLFHHLKEFQIKNVKQIPNTISVSEYNHDLRNIVRPRLLWVRAFASIYNPEMALKVFSKLKKIYPDAELCMVGPYKDMSKEVVQQLIEKNKVDIKLSGRLTKAEWTQLSKKYDIFINTTHFDNTPVSVIEAMALGLPIVSTNVGGIPFLLEDRENALLVNDSDVDEMVKSITELIENPELARKLSVNGRKEAEQFDWNVVKNQWKEILK
ncbi:glycosyltransferase family 4 protein [Flavobacterium sp.]|uniref:glycosyltransferase family 4 protein n=1 Tax=Flavobacterium sp. TaxID=239 RepID=UPI0025BBDC9C|nr:glycosyltransferase family 4 protein [Flavobacterium sp.]MBA4154168.1 glycosyl transferase family 1 [Flavobacterium sp.]